MPWAGCCTAPSPARRALVRSNLRRVCRYLAAAGLAAPPTVLAASDEAALERLVREAFGHYVRGYLEGAIVSAYAGARGRGRAKVTADDPDLAEEILGPAGGPGRAVIVIGMHFGAVEIPGLYAADRGVVMTSPMETVADPDVQAYLLRGRSASGLRLVGRASVPARELARRPGSPARPVALVADRARQRRRRRASTLFGGTCAAAGRRPAVHWLAESPARRPSSLVTARRTGWGRLPGVASGAARDVPAERERGASGWRDSWTRRRGAFERAVAVGAGAVVDAVLPDLGRSRRRGATS
jgi:hypothetical protein